MIFSSQLPDSVLLSLMCSWVCAKELTLVDSACTNREKRNFLLEKFSMSYFIISESNYRKPGILGWIQLRNIKLQVINLISLDFFNTRLRHNINSSRIVSITVSCKEDLWNEVEIAQLINNSPLLSALHLTKLAYFNDELFCQVHKKILNQLLELTVVVTQPANRPNVDDFLSLIAEDCHNLTNLRFEFDRFTVKGVMEIVKNNVNLQHIYLNIQDCASHEDLMVAVTNHCPNLLSFTLLESEYFMNIKSVVSMITTLKHLECVQINKDRYNYKHVLYKRAKHTVHKAVVLSRMSSAEFLSFNEKITDFTAMLLYDVEFVTDVELEVIIQNNGNLQQLELTFSIDGDSRFTINKLLTLVRTCKQLNTLILQACDNLTCADFTALFNCIHEHNSVHFKRFYIGWHETVTLDVFIHALDTLKGLTHLCFFECPLANKHELLAHLYQKSNYAVTLDRFEIDI